MPPAAEALPSACVVLVPVGGGGLDPGCEAALRGLERAGHPVRRVYGYAQVDVARNQMASDALADGFDELLWVDADVVFDPADVARLRAHGLPFVCGLYAKKGPAELACALLPGTPPVRFGPAGGLLEVRYAGLGFAHTRAALYRLVHHRLGLPVCNRQFPHPPLVPFFEPLTADDPGGPWALGEDYAFCERVRRCGVAVLADTAVRLWHVGPYRYGWEDAAGPRDRHPDFVLDPPGRPAPGGGEV